MNHQLINLLDEVLEKDYHDNPERKRLLSSMNEKLGKIHEWLIITEKGWNHSEDIIHCGIDLIAKIVRFIEEGSEEFPDFKPFI